MKTTKNNESQKESTFLHLLKKAAFLCLFILMSSGVHSQTYLIVAGSNIYEVDHATCTETLLCSSLIVNTGGGTTSSTITDIAYHPNGNLYAIVANYFISVDIGTCVTTTIATHSTGSNALVAAADGTLYAASDDLYTVDINTGVFTSLGTLPCTSSGDLTFHEGELFLTCDNGDLLNIEISNPANSSVVGNLGVGYWHGLWTIHTDCNNSQVLVATQNEIYAIDLNTATTTLNCTLGTSWIGGGTTIGDYNASECGCSASLGPDQDLCNGEITLNAGAPNSSYFWQDGSTDSTLVVSIAGTYYVEVTDTIEACTSSDTIVVEACDLGFEESQLDVSIYPSPSDGLVNIIFNKEVETKIIILDISGRIIHQNAYNSDKIQLDLSSFANGTYFISFLNNENSIVLSKKIQLLK